MAEVLSAFDKWRGTATSREASAAAAGAAQSAGFTAEVIGVSDGGEGFLEALGGANRTSRIQIGDHQVPARWRLEGDSGFVEMSMVDGLALKGGPESNDALDSGTRSTGALIGAVVGTGVRRVVVGLGGSAGTDGGLGCVEVLRGDPRFKTVDLIGACDVMVPFASALEFAGQKGATPAERRLLEGRLERVAQIYESEFGVDVRPVAGAGAAGGLGGGLVALGGSLVPGFDLVAEETGFDEHLARAGLVVTGEGWLDEHSFDGKAVGEVLARCAALRVEALVVVGGAEPEAVERAEAMGARVTSLVEQYGSERARSHTLECIESAVATALAS